MDILQVSIVVFLLLLIAAGFFFLDRYYRILLRKEVIRARRSEHIKTVFLANVSHALRTAVLSISRRFFWPTLVMRYVIPLTLLSPRVTSLFLKVLITLSPSIY